MTPAELDENAYHAFFEVKMLVDQIEFLIDDGSPYFPSSSSWEEPNDQALLEAVLVHLRLLDEFLACSGHHRDDVKACDWDGWTENGFLEEDDRKRINAHVAHLSCRRQDGEEWDLLALGKAGCDRLVEFFAAIPSERRDAFGDAPEIAERGQKRFEEELAK